MADGIIKGSEFISNDLFKRQEDLIKNQEAILKGQLNIIEKAKEFNKQLSGSNLANFNKTAKKSDENIRKLSNSQNQLVRNTKLLTDIQKIKAKQNDLETKAGQKLLKEQVRLTEARKKARIKAKKQLGVQKNIISFTKKLAGSFQNAALKVGAMFIAIKGLVNITKKIIKTTADFEKQMDKVAAVTKASDDEIKQLTNDAKRLGSVTSKSANEVGKLQEEFAKLGFSTAEILNATEATIRLSEATGSDLAQSAVVAASTVRGFGLDASETQRVVDVMAKSFSSSALDLNKFQTAMAQVAPVAKTAGISIEESTAMLSALVDAGLDASTAGTSLRNIFLENAKSGRSFSESMEVLNKASDKSSAAMDLFGKRGAVAAIVLSDNIDKTKDLTEAYENAEGAANQMAQTVQDNLTGDVTKLQSAWEGLVLSFDDGGGSMTKVLRSIIGFVTQLIADLKYLNSTSEDIFNQEGIKRAKDNINEVRKGLEGLGNEDLIKAYGLNIEYNNTLLLEQKELLKDLEEENSKKNKKDINLTKVVIQQLQEENKIYQNIIKTVQDAIQAEIDAEKKRIEQVRELNRKRAEDLKEFNDKMFEKNLEYKELEDELNESYFEKELELIQASIDATNEKYDKEIEAAGIAKEKEIEFAKKKAELERQLNRETTDQIINTAFAAANVLQSLNDREASAVESKYNKEIASAEKAGKDTEELERKKAKEVAKIRRKQAVIEKVAAITDIAINTAKGVMSVLSTGGGTRYADFGISAGILSAFVIATGALQAAAVAAKPLPEVPSFFKGGEHKGGLAEIHGQEIVSTKQGDFFTNWGKYEGKLIDLPKSEIIPNKDIFKQDIENIKNNSIDFNGGISVEKMTEAMKNNTKELKKAISNIPQPHYEGLTLTKIRRGNSTEIYYNNKYKMR